MTSKHIPVFSTPVAVKLSKDARRAFGGYVPRSRLLNEALPPEADLWSRPIYVPKQIETRAGSQDAFSVMSFGAST